ncbi:hypothetical protein JTE90_027760 [Oedothorax gibbosus]|uniref:Uncharacterized protein n=1 Tax=Oedothorax gibbosus TaxID=931172 RepID=A0AAV6V7S0_9ARAC|nr:hypothetical protein JTE90_027760 [Oedothorax gibbosus]
MKVSVTQRPYRKESAGKRIENEERKSTCDQSRNAEQSTDSHQNSSKEEKGRKSNEGVSATASKNKEPAGKGIENEEKESTIDQSRNAKNQLIIIKTTAKTKMDANLMKV